LAGHLDITEPYRRFAVVIPLWKWRKPLHCVMLIVCQPQASFPAWRFCSCWTGRPNAEEF